jgi:uracil phosphoribosyltransferase
VKYLFAFALIFSNIEAFAHRQALHQLVYSIRDPQTDSFHFREAIEKIGEYLALDVVEELNKVEASVQTLTGTVAKHFLLDENPVLVTILRGGLPLNAGVQKIFPNSEVGFFAMSRNEETLQAKLDYLSLPDLKNKCVILSDTMLATGGSLLDALQILEKFQPKKIFIVTAIASEPGLARIMKYNPSIKIFAAAIDPSLNSKGYIIPGLGDAGDRLYGKKIVASLEQHINQEIGESETKTKKLPHD